MRNRYALRIRSLIRKAFLVGPHTCPWWIGYTFDNPLRRLIHDPNSILGNWVAPGDTVVDIGCGLGYFSIAMADIVGSSGRVIALDIQQQMIRRARKRAEHRGVANRIDFRICEQDRLGYEGVADFALAFWMVHEVRDPKNLLAEIKSFLRPSGKLLITEPKVHVSQAEFNKTVNLVRCEGFQIVERPEIRFSQSVVCSPV
ncbi:MAG: methyltransferase domain-containing protein [Candidatus Thiodiazotropha lotti]|nr:methyltransferase domain-containing protein [Candidatus Thiodiazotropha lotti]MCG8002768.1 methyltransferase domain-containing protein [Candidatus Thiodiazotropha lotti]MCG8007114.1 methyltransferase domain-containing protein [Candidatus Thiodiazotropha lotti]MCW4186388.1 methyltransferase domain-containing protein [Candidatus Thiodiazotropha lotti]MCW4194695.1 methyltransferase domain-containing protein [Candidatus Thiodiazotropha lotti]